MLILVFAFSAEVDVSVNVLNLVLAISSASWTISEKAGAPLLDVAGIITGMAGASFTSRLDAMNDADADARNQARNHVTICCWEFAMLLQDLILVVTARQYTVEFETQ